MGPLETAKTLFLDGLRYFTNQQFQDAERSFLKSLEYSPKRPSILNNLAAVQIKLKKFDEAEINLKKVFEIDDKSIDLWFNLGVLYLERKQLAHAIPYLEKCIELDSHNIFGWKLLAQAHDQNKDFDKAIICLKKILNLNPSDLDAIIGMGAVLNDLKQYDLAIQHHQLAIRIDSNSISGYVNMGIAFTGLKKFELALHNYSIALDLDSSDSDIWLNQGNTLHALKRHEEAIAHYNHAIQLKPDFIEAWTSKGITLNELKRYDEAIVHFDKAISFKSDCVEAWASKGITLNELKRYDEAIIHFDKAISFKSDCVEAWASKGATFYELKCYSDALIYYDRALQLKPDYAEAWSNKGLTLNMLRRYDEAITHYDRAIQLKSDYAEAWSHKGLTLNILGRYDEAIVHFDKAISFKEDCVEAWANKGVSCFELNRYSEALTHSDRAIQLKPNFAEPWASKGITLNELKRYDEAIVHFDKAISLKADIDWIPGALLAAKMSICHWADLDDSLKKISARVIANEKVTPPFTLIALTDNALLHKQSAQIFIQDKYPLNTALGPIPKHVKKEKIRIGYFSADFRNHATGYLMAELFELHDKSQFELIGFSFGPMVNDEMRQRLKKPFNQFIDVGIKSDFEVALLSRSLNIDIAIDLKGFTQYSRTGIFSYRAAPIQVNFIGYPGTMSADYIDYLIADKELIPDVFQSCYSEKLVYLPNSYQVNDRKRFISDKQFTRQELRLPENSFVFCCFNNNYKILPTTFCSWMRILKAVEGSVLWLLQDNFLVVENLKKEAQLQGINPQRLVFADRFPLSNHLARHHQADLFLDTFPCNAHTTASDALWTGLPVLTLIGQSFASRVASSLLNAIGLRELITNTQEEYEALAIELAMNPKKLADIKLKLANNRFTEPLFNTPLFAKNLEAAYIKMYEQYQADFLPENIYLN